MNKTICAIAAIASLLFANTVMAQESKTDTVKKKKHHSIVLSTSGLKIKDRDTTVDEIRAGKLAEDSDDEGKQMGKPRFKANLMMLDLGINVLQDNTNYADPGVRSYLNVPAANQNKSLFDLRPGKSINVNIYPWMMKYAAIRTKNQRLYITTGIGLQLYNFRYEEPLTYTKNPAGVVLDTRSFKKDKLGMDYLNIPLMLTFKTRLHKDTWLVYGGGITAGYRIASWNKQVWDGHKTKVHDAFGTADFNSCITAEFGIDGMFRFYGSYQLTSLYQNGIDQHPVSFGIRFSGI